MSRETLPSPSVAANAGQPDAGGRATALPSPQRDRGRSQQIVLACLIAVELVTFALLGQNFLTRTNAFEVLRLGVELGLLALALTPVIVTGGIDLSVGSMLGLTAVIFGKLWRDAGLSPPVAAMLAVGCGAGAGLINALFITQLRVPALIVTLGSFSLYRGLAEGMTGGVDNFTNFPAGFCFSAKATSGWLPTQGAIFIVAAVGFWILLHRSTIGRALSAIGYSTPGARYAGIPVERRVGLTYVLSGICAAVAAVIYVAHWGQAKADAGTGFELQAITAVVLGGTSIFGGRGSIGGTLLGLLAIALLRNGLAPGGAAGRAGGCADGDTAARGDRNRSLSHRVSPNASLALRRRGLWTGISQRRFGPAGSSVESNDGYPCS